MVGKQMQHNWKLSKQANILILKGIIFFLKLGHLKEPASHAKGILSM